MDIFAEIHNALQAEEQVAVATIVAAAGSTPAPLLSKMLVTRHGRSSIGTVGGGCTEGDILLHAERVLEAGVAAIVRFTLDEDDRGLVCGGTIDVLVEPVTRADLPVYDTVMSCRTSGERCALVTLLGEDMRVVRKAVARAIPGPQPDGVPADLIALAFEEGRTLKEKVPGGLCIVELIEGAAPLVIFGGGHVGRAISRVAALTGFVVTVVDDRPKYASRERFPEAAETVVADFDAIGAIVKSKHAPFLLIVTRGHRHDEEILRQIVAAGGAPYVGMIGSRRKVLTTYERLLASGISAERLGGVYAPVGLAIGAVSAEEIAVSVVAEMVAVRRGAAGGTISHLSQGARLHAGGAAPDPHGG